MAEKLEVSQSLRGAYTITESVIRKLCDHLFQATGAPVSVSVKLKGDRTITSRDPEVVLSDSSLSRYSIESIKINSNNYDTTNSTYITIGYSDVKPILIQIEGDRRYVLMVEDTLKNELDGVKSPLSWLLYTKQKTFDFGITMIILSAFIMSILLISIIYPKEFVEYIPPYILPSFAFTFYILTYFISFIIPSVSFNFGKGKVNLDLKNKILKLIIGGVVFGVAVNLLSNFFAARFFPG